PTEIYTLSLHDALPIFAVLIRSSSWSPCVSWWETWFLLGAARPETESQLEVEISAGDGFVGRGMVVDELEQAAHADRLRLVRPGAEPLQLLHLPAGRVGGQDDDRDRPGRRVATQGGEDLDAGDVRQVQVEEDQVGMVVARELDPELALHRGDQADA